MSNYYWNDWYAGWGWFLWVGMIFLFFSSFGNWGYTYRTDRRHRDGFSSKDATDFLNERYAKGEINREEFLQIKSEIQNNRLPTNAVKTAKDSSFLKPQTTM